LQKKVCYDFLLILLTLTGSGLLPKIMN
jgi:hypothetical protein